MKLDDAVVALLNLQSRSITVTKLGGGCSSASVAKIVAFNEEDGTQKQFFMKSGIGKVAEVMFRGEHESLNAIHNAVASLCPRSYGWGQFTGSPNTYFLVTDFLDLGARSSSSGKTKLATKLADLHTTPVPIPQGHDKPMFGFEVTTCCGDTPQDNTWSSCWADFYANQRLCFILKRCEKANGHNAELHRLVETMASVVVPRLLVDSHLNNGRGIFPVVVHGDLWSGNVGHGSGPSEDVIYDSSACYAHNEYELGIMKMFGGFGASFLAEYHKLCPKTEPVSEYSDRIALYELYHHLNHYALFGGSYKSGAINIMKKLIGKYGNSSDSTPDHNNDMQI